MRTTIRVVGTVILLAAVAVYIVKGLTSDDLLGWLNGWLAAPILALTILPFLFIFTSKGLQGLRLGGAHSAAYRDAPVAIATVTQVTTTGLQINDQPQLAFTLQVETPDGHRFTSTARQIVPLGQLGQIGIGTVLPVRYRPDQLDFVEIVLDPNEPAAREAMRLVQLSRGIGSPDAPEIMARGVPGQAVVIAMTPTGELVQGNPRLNLSLSVSRPDGYTFPLEISKVVPANSVGRFQPGSVINVQYLPEDPSRLVIAMPANA